MRYRRSKNYKEKLEVFEGSVVVSLEDAKQCSWGEIFGNDRPLYLEVGMGKGQFIRSMAMLNLDNNYVGIEKIEPLLLGGAEKIVAQNIENIKLVALNANYLEEFFSEKSVEGIYLNFSDPWPKDRYANRRLTHKNMLKRYKDVLKEDGFIEFKTDNEALFDFSVEEMDSFGFSRIEYSRNLHEDMKGIEIITTEYEDKFRNMGKEIFFVKYSVKTLENVED